MEREQIENRVAGVRSWWHSIDLGQGVVTPGQKAPEQLALELRQMELPSLQGKSVLDIGAWDGFFSFACEQRGAARVLALDHYVWSMDVPAMIQYWQECKQKGVVPRQYHELPELWDPERLIGKRGFDTAHELLGSKVETKIADFMTTDLSELGSFDVVLYLGVLYHIEEPLRALKRLAQVTKELAVIETEAISVDGYGHKALFEFYGSNELNGDVSNWWAPNEQGLCSMCLAAGFREVRVLTTPGAGPSLFSKVKRGISDQPQEPRHYRLIVHARK